MTQHTLLGICGSLRAASFNRKLMREAMRLYGDASTTEADLRLPLYDGDLEQSEGVPAAAKTLAAKIEEADAVIMASPEYNKAITGVLKNMLDWISRVDGNPWLGKPIAILSASAGRTGGEAGQQSLRLAMAAFRPHFTCGPFVMVAGAASEFDDDGRLKSELYLQSLTQAMDVLRQEAEAGRASRASSSSS